VARDVGMVCVRLWRGQRYIASRCSEGSVDDRESTVYLMGAHNHLDKNGLVVSPASWGAKAKHLPFSVLSLSFQ
jgi:hypothetical protein